MDEAMTREELMALVHLQFPGAVLHERSEGAYNWAAIIHTKTIIGGAQNRKYICIVQPDETMSVENVFQLLCAKFIARRTK